LAESEPTRVAVVDRQYFYADEVVGSLED